MSQAQNNTLLKKLIVVALVMFGFGFALVPFYKKICEVTGINNLLKPDEQKPLSLNQTRQITLELDANVRDLPWRFNPSQNKVTLHTGQIVEIAYEVENNSDKTITGQAIPSYGPQQAGEFVKKLECFCFKQQILKPHEKKRMPVRFIVDPAIPAEINTITLSYTFFRVEGAN